MRILSDLKDDVSKISAKIILGKILKKYGELIHLNIDTLKKCLSIEIILKGEDKPIVITINNYEVFSHPAPAIKFKSVNVDREWINLLAGDYLEGKEFPIPRKYSLIIKLIL